MAITKTSIAAEPYGVLAATQITAVQIMAVMPTPIHGA